MAALCTPASARCIQTSVHQRGCCVYSSRVTRYHGVTEYRMPGDAVSVLCTIGQQQEVTYV